MSREITYQFNFEDGTSWDYTIQFDHNNFFISKEDCEPKEWTLLENHKCPHCPLKKEDFPHCPVAKNMNQFVEDSKDTLSSKQAEMLVITPERTYSKKGGNQEGLRSLFGVIMAASGCPHLDWLRPLVRFHLPFADLDETLFRALSLQLLYQYFNNRHSDLSSCGADLEKNYEAVETLNHSFIDRIRAYCSADADKNAIAALDTFVQMFSFQYESDFKTLKKYFS